MLKRAKTTLNITSVPVVPECEQLHNNVGGLKFNWNETDDKCPKEMLVSGQQGFSIVDERNHDVQLDWGLQPSSKTYQLSSKTYQLTFELKTCVTSKSVPVPGRKMSIDVKKMLENTSSNRKTAKFRLHHQTLPFG